MTVVDELVGNEHPAWAGLAMASANALPPAKSAVRRPRPLRPRDDAYVLPKPNAPERSDPRLNYAEQTLVEGNDAKTKAENAKQKKEESRPVIFSLAKHMP